MNENDTVVLMGKSHNEFCSFSYRKGNNMNGALKFQNYKRYVILTRCNMLRYFDIKTFTLNYYCSAVVR